MISLPRLPDRMRPARLNRPPGSRRSRLEPSCAVARLRLGLGRAASAARRRRWRSAFASRIANAGSRFHGANSRPRRNLSPVRVAMASRWPPSPCRRGPRTPASTKQASRPPAADKSAGPHSGQSPMPGWQNSQIVEGLGPECDRKLVRSACSRCAGSPSIHGGAHLLRRLPPRPAGPAGRHGCGVMEERRRARAAFAVLQTRRELAREFAKSDGSPGIKAGDLCSATGLA